MAESVQGVSIGGIGTSNDVAKRTNDATRCTKEVCKRNQVPTSYVKELPQLAE